MEGQHLRVRVFQGAGLATWVRFKTGQGWFKALADSLLERVGLR